MKISELTEMTIFGKELSFGKTPKNIPQPTKSYEDFVDRMQDFEEHSGHKYGEMSASEFVSYPIENWQRNRDPRLAAVMKTVNSRGISEPISMGHTSNGRIIVSDGGHRATAAVQYWLTTGKDIKIPFYYKL